MFLRSCECDSLSLLFAPNTFFAQILFLIQPPYRTNAKKVAFVTQKFPGSEIFLPSKNILNPSAIPWRSKGDTYRGCQARRHITSANQNPFLFSFYLRAKEHLLHLSTGTD